MSQTKDFKKQTAKLQEYLESKYKNADDFIIINNNVYSKTSLSYNTLSGINEIIPVKAIFFLSKDCKPYKLNFKIGVCLIQN